MQERRRCRRNRTFLAAAMAGRDGRFTMDCVVRDLSEDGALLLVDDPPGMPREVDLRLGPGQGVRRARIVWRGESAVGIGFVPVDRPNVIPFPGASRSAGPEADRDRLAQRIARFVRPRNTDAH